MSAFLNMGLIGIAALLAGTRSDQGFDIFSLQSHARVAVSGGAAGQGRASPKRALVDTDHQKLRRIILPEIKYTRRVARSGLICQRA